MFQFNSPLFSGIACVVWFNILIILEVVQHFKNKIWLNSFCFTEKMYFAPDCVECNRFVPPVSLSTMDSDNGDATIGAVHGAEPEPPGNSAFPEPSKHQQVCSGTQNKHTWTSAPVVIPVPKVLPNEPIDVGAAQVTSSVTRDCQKSHMPGGTGVWRHLASQPIVSCFTLSPGLSGYVGSGLVWLGFYGTREKRRRPCGLSDERVEPSNEYSEFSRTTRTWAVVDSLW